jgi:hypothetical protein
MKKLPSFLQLFKTIRKSLPPPTIKHKDKKSIQEKIKMKTTIKYYTQNIYGVRREKFIDKGQESVFIQLTGRKTLDSVSRELIRDLSGSSIEFEQVLPPE